jgi:hypothetical protein
LFNLDSGQNLLSGRCFRRTSFQKVICYDFHIMRDEATYICDSCGEEIVVPVDPSAGMSQEYVEDCPVCCSPNIIYVEIDDDGSARVWSEPE